MELITVSMFFLIALIFIGENIIEKIFGGK